MRSRGYDFSPWLCEPPANCHVIGGRQSLGWYFQAKVILHFNRT